MALNLEVSNKAPALPIDITVDLMDAFEIFSDTYGGSKLGQPSMKALQCIPLTWAYLAVKEAIIVRKQKISATERRRGATRKSRFLAGSSCATEQSTSQTARCGFRRGGKRISTTLPWEVRDARKVEL